MRQKNQLIKSTGARGYLEWLKMNQPLIYRGISNKLTQPNLSGMGADNIDPIAIASTAPAQQSWIDNIKQLVQGAASIYLTKTQLDQQSKITDLQLQRARQGLPPLNIDPTSYGLSRQAEIDHGKSKERCHAASIEKILGKASSW